MVIEHNSSTLHSSCLEKEDTIQQYKHSDQSNNNR